MTAHAEWKYFDGTNTFNSYIDYSRIKTEGRYKSMWDLNDYESPQTFQGKQYKSSMTKRVVDCQASRYQYLAIFDYSEQMGNGEVVHSSNYQIAESSWRYSPPNSIGDRFINIACGRK